MNKTVFTLNYQYHYYGNDGDITTWAIYDSKEALLADLEPYFLRNSYRSEKEVQDIIESLEKNNGYYDMDDISIWIVEREVYTSSKWTKEDSWAELKETIEELKDNGGEG